MSEAPLLGGFPFLSWKCTLGTGPLLETGPRGYEVGWAPGQREVPVGALLDHFKHADVEGCVGRAGAGLFVYPELSGCDSLTSRDLG